MSRQHQRNTSDEVWLHFWTIQQHKISSSFKPWSTSTARFWSTNCRRMSWSTSASSTHRVICTSCHTRNRYSCTLGISQRATIMFSCIAQRRKAFGSGTYWWTSAATFQSTSIHIAATSPSRIRPVISKFRPSTMSRHPLRVWRSWCSRTWCRSSPSLSCTYTASMECSILTDPSK